jgi:hypothetical protein
MHPDLQQLFERIENQRNDLLSRVEKLTPEQYRFSKNGKWSIAQILTHLITSERLSFGYMKKKSLGIDKAGDSGIIEDLRYALLKISQRIAFLKFRAPKIVVENTPAAMSFPEVKKEWADLRGDIKTFLEKIDEKNIRKKIYKHPVAGRLNVKQAIGFLSEHINHHLPQINRLL